jgi:hypothetical protein
LLLCFTFFYFLTGQETREKISNSRFRQKLRIYGYKQRPLTPFNLHKSRITEKGFARQA